MALPAAGPSREASILTGGRGRDGRSSIVDRRETRTRFGFLEQVTGSATMLKSAASRVSYRARTVVDVDIPRMLPNQAQMIDRGSDRDLFEFFVRETLRQNPFMRREAAENIVNNRARTMLQQTAAVARDTFIALDRFIRSKADLPGRKLRA